MVTHVWSRYMQQVTNDTITCNYYFVFSFDDFTAAGLNVTTQIAHVSVSRPWKKISWKPIPQSARVAHLIAAVQHQSNRVWEMLIIAYRYQNLISKRIYRCLRITISKHASKIISWPWLTFYGQVSLNALRKLNSLWTANTMFYGLSMV